MATPPGEAASAACTSGTSSMAHSADVAAERTAGTTLRVWGSTKFAMSPERHTARQIDSIATADRWQADRQQHGL